MAINQYDVPSGGQMRTDVTATIGSSNAQYTAGKVEVLVDSSFSKVAILKGLEAVMQYIETSAWPA